MLGTCAWRVSEGSWDPLNTSVGYAIDSSVGHSVRLLDIGSARRALVKDVTLVRFLTSSHPSVPAHSFRGCRPTQLVFTTTDGACLFVCPFVLNGRERFLDGRNTLINYPYSVTHQSRWRVVEYIGIFLSLMLLSYTISEGQRGLFA